MYIVRRFVYRKSCDASLEAEVVSCSDLDEVKFYMDKNFTKFTSYRVEWDDD